MSTLTIQKAFLNNFKDIINRRVDIREDIKHYQDTLSYTSCKVPSTQKVTKISHKDTTQPTTAHGLAITHEEEKVALILSLAVGFATWHLF